MSAERSRITLRKWALAAAYGRTSLERQLAASNLLIAAEGLAVELEAAGRRLEELERRPRLHAVQEPDHG